MFVQEYAKELSDEIYGTYTSIEDIIWEVSSVCVKRVSARCLKYPKAA